MNIGDLVQLMDWDCYGMILEYGPSNIHSNHICEIMWMWGDEVVDPNTGWTDHVYESDLTILSQLSINC